MSTVPKVFDPSIDDFREVTQDDVNMFTIHTEFFGQLSYIIKILFRANRLLWNKKITLEDLRVATAGIFELNKKMDIIEYNEIRPDAGGLGVKQDSATGFEGTSL